MTIWLPSLTLEELNREFAALSEDEQRRIMRERHGLEPALQETPEFVSHKLSCFERALDTITKKEEYETALFIMPEHVASDRFRLSFLRADGFDEHAAATRMAKYWERKVELFGIDKAFKPYVSLLDFDEDDFEALARGGIRLLPFPDAHGRAILFNHSMYFVRNIRAMTKLLWWILHKAVFHENDGENIQQKGIVIMGGLLCSNPELFGDRKEYWINFGLSLIKIFTMDAFDVLPIKLVAIHRFQSTAFNKAVLEHFLRTVRKKIRSKMNFHNSFDPQTTASNLLSCGITPEIIPWQLGGCLDFDYQTWIGQSVLEDMYNASSARSINCDVLEEAVPHALRHFLSVYRQEEVDTYSTLLSSRALETSE